MQTPQVQRIAAERRFGAHVKSFAASGVSAGQLAVVFSSLLVIAGAVLVYEGGSGKWGSGVVLLCVAAAVFAAGHRRDRRVRATAARAHCYEHGMVLATGSDGDVVPYSWSDVVPFEFMESGPDTRDRLRLILRDREGHQLLRLTAEEVERVARLLLEDELPRARAVLEQGGSLVHGRFTLDTAGLAVDGEIHPWSAVRDVSAEDRSFVTVSLHGTRKRTKVPCSETPHLRALLTLAQERRI